MKTVIKKLFSTLCLLTLLFGVLEIPILQINQAQAADLLLLGNTPVNWATNVPTDIPGITLTFDQNVFDDGDDGAFSQGEASWTGGTILLTQTGSVIEVPMNISTTTDTVSIQLLEELQESTVYNLTVMDVCPETLTEPYPDECYFELPALSFTTASNTCSNPNFAACDTEGECTWVSGYWYSDECWAEPQESNFEQYDNQTDCQSNGGVRVEENGDAWCTDIWAFIDDVPCFDYGSNSHQPDCNSNITDLSTAPLTVTGADLVSYKYAIGFSDYNNQEYFDCGIELAAASEIPLSTQITDDISNFPDGEVFLCAIGKDSSGEWQSDHTFHNWFKNTQNGNSSFFVDEASYPVDTSFLKDQMINVDIEAVSFDWHFIMNVDVADTALDFGANVANVKLYQGYYDNMEVLQGLDPVSILTVQKDGSDMKKINLGLEAGTSLSYATNYTLAIHDLCMNGYTTPTPDFVNECTKQLIRFSTVGSGGNTVFGNGILEAGEECDDGNTDNNDGCSDMAQTEAGYFCSANPTTQGTPADPDSVCAVIATSDSAVIITEFKYSPDTGLFCDYNDANIDHNTPNCNGVHFIELHNTGSSSADISNFQMMAGGDYFQFPGSTTLNAGGYTLIYWNITDQTELTTLNAELTGNGQTAYPTSVTNGLVFYGDKENWLGEVMLLESGSLAPPVYDMESPLCFWTDTTAPDPGCFPTLNAGSKMVDYVQTWSDFSCSDNDPATACTHFEEELAYQQDKWQQGDWLDGGFNDEESFGLLDDLARGINDRTDDVFSRGGKKPAWVVYSVPTPGNLNSGAVKSDFYVIGANPDKDEQDVSLFEDVEIYLSKEVAQPALYVNNINIKLKKVSDSSEVSGFVEYQIQNPTNFVWDPTISFVPDAPLEMDTEYKLEINAEIKDITGKTLGNPFSFNFRTENIVGFDPNQLQVVWTAPEDGMEGAPMLLGEEDYQTPLIVEFSKTVADSLILEKTGGVLENIELWELDWDGSDLMEIVDLDGAAESFVENDVATEHSSFKFFLTTTTKLLKPNTKYKLTVFQEVGLTADYSFEFKTADSIFSGTGGGWGWGGNCPTEFSPIGSGPFNNQENVDIYLWNAQVFFPGDECQFAGVDTTSVNNNTVKFFKSTDDNGTPDDWTDDTYQTVNGIVHLDELTNSVSFEPEMFPLPAETIFKIEVIGSLAADQARICNLGGKCLKESKSYYFKTAALATDSNGEFVGRVVDENTGNPLVDYEVFFHTYDPCQIDEANCSSTTTEFWNNFVWREVRTDNNGEFVIEGLSAGEYVVDLPPQGEAKIGVNTNYDNFSTKGSACPFTTLNDWACISQKIIFTQNANVDLEEINGSTSLASDPVDNRSTWGDAAQVYEFSLIQSVAPVTIRGTVENSISQPLEEVIVNLSGMEYWNEFKTSSTTRDVFEDENCNFWQDTDETNVISLAAGEYIFQCVPPNADFKINTQNQQQLPDYFNSVNTVASDITHDITLEFDNSKATVEGTLTIAANCATSSSWNYVAINLHKPFDWFNTNEEEFFWDEDNDRFLHINLDDCGSDPDCNFAGGIYTYDYSFPGLNPSEDFEINAWKEGCADHFEQITTPTAGNSLTKNILLNAGTVFSGTVLDEASNPIPFLDIDMYTEPPIVCERAPEDWPPQVGDEGYDNGEDYWPAEIGVPGSPTDEQKFVNFEEYCWNPTNNAFGWGTSDASGDFSIGGLKTNKTYRVNIYGTQNKKIVDIKNVSDVSIYSSGSVIVTGTMTGNTIILGQGMRVRGEIIDKNSREPIAWARVDLENSKQFYHSMPTGPDGYYSILGVEEGTYNVFAYAQNGEYIEFEDQIVIGANADNLFYLPVELDPFDFEQEPVDGSLTIDESTVVVDKSLASPGDTLTYYIKLKNDLSTEAISGDLVVTLPNEAKIDAASVQFYAGNQVLPVSIDGVDNTISDLNRRITAGGEVIMKVTLRINPNLTSAEGSLKLKATFQNMEIEPNIGSPVAVGDIELGQAFTSLAFATIEGPATVKSGDVNTFTVYGKASADATVTVKDGETILATTKADGKWWNAEVFIVDVAGGTHYLTVTSTKNGVTSKPSEPLEVEVTTDEPILSKVDITAGSNGTVSSDGSNNGIPAFALFEGEQVDINTYFDSNALPDIDSGYISAEFLDANINLVQDWGHLWSSTINEGWTGFGEKKIYLTYNKGNNSYTQPIAEVLILIDPSGYVCNGECSDDDLTNRIEGVTATVEYAIDDDGNTITCIAGADTNTDSAIENSEEIAIGDSDNLATVLTCDANGLNWVSWDAASTGQINPQSTDETGRYGWNVPQGWWRVKFQKANEYSLTTSRAVYVPPAETELNLNIGPSDIQKPTVVSSLPSNDAVSISPSVNPNVTFSEKMTQNTINTNNIILTQGGNVITATIDYNDSNYTATVTPIENLSYDTVYNLKIKTNVTDSNGQALEAEQVIAFTTASQPDTTAPSSLASAGGTSLVDNAQFESSVTVSLAAYTNTLKTTLDNSAIIHYTTDDSTPTTDSKVYSSALNFSVNAGITANKTIKFFAIDTAGNTESLQTKSFSITAKDQTAPNIVASPGYGVYNYDFVAGKTIDIQAYLDNTSSNSDNLDSWAIIYYSYTNDGSDPVEATVDDSQYAAPLSINTLAWVWGAELTKTLKLSVMAIDDNGNASNKEFTYVISKSDDIATANTTAEMVSYIESTDIMNIAGNTGEALRIPKITYTTVNEKVEAVADVSSLLTWGTTFRAGSQGMTLVREDSSGNELLKAEIPAETEVVMAAAANGLFTMPTVQENTVVSVSGGSVQKVIEIGAGDNQVALSKAAKITVPNQNTADWTFKVSWKQGNTTEEITRCDNTVGLHTQTEIDILLDAGEDCYDISAVNANATIYIRTRHFTSFFTWVAAVVNVVAPSGGSGWGGGIAAVTAKLSSIFRGITQSISLVDGGDVQDSLTVKRNGKNVIASLFSKTKGFRGFQVGDVIANEKTAQMELDGFTDVVMQADSEIELEKASENYLRYGQKKGNIWYKFDKGGNTGEKDMTYKVATNNTVATVRGTTFNTIVHEDGTEEFQLLEGELRIYNKIKKKNYNIVAGDRLLVYTDGRTKIVYSDSVEGEQKTLDSINAIIPEYSYVDVIDHWSQNYVEKLSKLKIVGGVGGGKSFAPDDNISRVELLKIVLLWAGHNVDDLTTEQKEELITVFTDINESWMADQWRARYVYYAYKNDIVTGYDSGEFKVDQNVTRAESLKIVAKAFAVELNTKVVTVTDTGLNFVDIHDYQWYLPYLKNLVNKAVIKGFEIDGKSYFNPALNITRAESVKIISVMMEL